MIGKEAIDFIIENGIDKRYEVKECKKRRSRNANSYMWELLQQLAMHVRTSKEDLYRKYIKEYGIFRTITLNPEAVSTFMKIWQERGIGWFCEISDSREKEVNVIAYYGTSVYNSKQFNNLIQHIVDDCRENNIETLTTVEILEMGL